MRDEAYRTAELSAWCENCSGVISHGHLVKELNTCLKMADHAADELKLMADGRASEKSEKEFGVNYDAYGTSDQLTATGVHQSTEHASP